MQIFIFGKPGSGKTHLGRRLEEEYGFLHYDADQDLTDELRERAASGQGVPEEVRDRYLGRIITRLAHITESHNGDIVTTQALILDRHRQELLNHFLALKFVLVECDEPLRLQRISERQDIPIDPTYARKIGNDFEPVGVPHITVVNDRNSDILPAMLTALEYSLD